MISDFHFVHLEGFFPDFLLDLLVLLAGVALLVFAVSAWGILRRRRTLRVFGVDAQRTTEWLAACSRRRWLRAGLLAVSLSCLTLALLEPRCNPEKARFKREARDVVVLVDVSRSMLARDLNPNRLEKAKDQIKRLSYRLAGDRVGLVAFAGDAVIKCPLTSNYSYFRSVVRNLSTSSASQGGTRIGDAIRKALRDLLGLESVVDPEEEKGVQPGETILEADARSTEKSYSDLLIITDGEDHDSYPKRAAESAAAVDVGLYIVGLGSEDGEPIPIGEKDGKPIYLKYEGEVVESRLNATVLREMVLTTPRGACLAAGTDHFDLVGFYKGVREKEEGREVVEERVSWTEVYQPFLLGGLFFYFLFLIVPERPRGRRSIALAEVKA